MARRRIAVALVVLVAAVLAPLGGAGSGGGAAARSRGAAMLAVPAYAQQRNLSCEYAALSMAMGTFGAWVSEYEFDERVGRSANPHWGFRGDITGWWGGTDDYGVYAEPLATAAAAFGFRGEVFYAEGDAGALTARLDRGLPTLVWIGLFGDTGYYETAADGTSYKIAAGEHAVVAYGYDEGGVHVADPAYGTYTYYSWGDFMWMWNVFDGMALAVGPA